MTNRSKGFVVCDSLHDPPLSSSSSSSSSLVATYLRFTSLLPSLTKTLALPSLNQPPFPIPHCWSRPNFALYVNLPFLFPIAFHCMLLLHFFIFFLFSSLMSFPRIVWTSFRLLAICLFIAVFPRLGLLWWSPSGFRISDFTVRGSSEINVL